ncbi:MAG TPA: class I SAM-dependent methyltransferase [Tepidisphaeraceae bacterium]|jgi:predicted O-methyltransferase YrrM
MKSTIRKVVRYLSREVQGTLPRNTPPTDLVLDHLLASQDMGSLNDAVAYVADLRQCVEPLKCQVNLLKRPKGISNASEAAFVALTDLLKASLPPVPVNLAMQFARIGDDYRGVSQVASRKDRAMDVRRHFTLSSSSGRKGRLLTAAVRAFEPRLVLELGTAYGISGFFIANALKAGGHPGSRLVTVEAFEPQATLSRTLLQREFGDAVTCEFGLAGESLPRLAATMDHIDFYFHDAGHTYDDYVNDVGVMLPKMSSGSVLFLDDIRWDDRRFIDKPSRAYEGWQAIVANPRTCAAAEIDDELGVAVFS